MIRGYVIKKGPHKGQCIQSVPDTYLFNVIRERETRTKLYKEALFEAGRRGWTWESMKRQLRAKARKERRLEIEERFFRLAVEGRPNKRS